MKFKKRQVQELDYDKMPEADMVLNYIDQRFKAGRGTIIIVIGLPGSGKSGLCQRIVEKRNASLPEGKKIKMTIHNKFHHLVAEIRISNLGDAPIVEEGAVLFPSRRAMSGDNVDLSAVLDTVRKKQLCILINAPFFLSLDSHLRTSGDILIETESIDKQKGIVISKMHRLQSNPRSSKIYTHTFTRDGYDVPIMFTRKPDANTWSDYEKQKDKSMDELYERIEFRHRKKQEKLDKEMGKLVQPSISELTERELQVFKLVNVDRLTQKQTADRLGIDPSRVCVIMKNVKKKTEIQKAENTIDGNSDTTPAIKIISIPQPDDMVDESKDEVQADE